MTRAIAILRRLGRSDEPIGVNQLARDLDLVPSTCLHILRVLEDECLVAVDPLSKRYSIDVGILPIARAAIQRNAFATLLQPHLDDLATRFEVTGVATQLTDPTHMVVVALSQVQLPFRLQVDMGSRFPALISATGRCFAAFNGLDEKALRERFAGCIGTTRRTSRPGAPRWRTRGRAAMPSTAAPTSLGSRCWPCRSSTAGVVWCIAWWPSAFPSDLTRRGFPSLPRRCCRCATRSPRCISAGAPRDGGQLARDAHRRPDRRDRPPAVAARGRGLALRAPNPLAHANAIGVIHGGTLMALLDQTATLAALWLTGSKAIVTVQMDTRFLSPVRVGELLEAEGTLRHRSRSTLFLDAGISVGDRLVADASAIMKIVPETGEGGRDDD